MNKALYNICMQTTLHIHHDAILMDVQILHRCR